jgi:hypothetical protein
LARSMVIVSRGSFAVAVADYDDAVVHVCT